MNIEVEFFASLREALGVQTIEIPASATGRIETVQDVLEWVRSSIRGAEASVLAAKRIRYAVNDEFVDLSCRVSAGDRVAFMPAVTGG